LADLSSAARDLDSALGFAVVWQRNAVTGAARSNADAYLSHLKTFAERKALRETMD
jgi:hypothetical protein